jgi:tetratricopeptide (TPR) repeat protein
MTNNSRVNDHATQPGSPTARPAELTDADRRLLERIASAPPALAGPLANDTFRLSGIRFPISPSSGAPLGGFGPYRIRRALGSGGFGFVVLGRDAAGRRVAVKILKPELANIPEFRARFRRAAETARSIRDPRVVRVLDAGDFVNANTGQSLPYIVMEYAGRPVSALLARHGGSSPLQPMRAARIVRDAARGIAAAHRLGIAHRDVKPGNLLIGIDLRVRVVDFDTARAVAPGATITREAEDILGTPCYMAPEQLTGHKPDLRSDVYALGMVLYELLTGAPAFRGSLPCVFEQIRYADPPPPHTYQENIPSGLETICLRALQKDRRRRHYATAAELADDLERFVDGKPIKARPVGRAERIWRWCCSHPAQAGLVAAVAVILVGAIFAMTQLLMLREADERQRSDMALAFNQDGESQFKEGRLDAACISFKSAVAILRDLVRKEPGKYEYHQRLGNSYYKLGKARQRQGHAEEALVAYRDAWSSHGQAIEKAPQQWPYRGSEFYNIARDLALCYTLAGDPDDADGAMEALRQAIANGFKNFEHIKNNPDFQALRTRDDFTKLLRALDLGR